ncbi:TPA: BlaI/MecI/CopY family transcriptional regulator [Legionella pneumophila]|nr:BlaI/MecI/CopY family transcriptional regulator [Legionella pneumophila]HAU1639683.1 BlaI/MecI/CopY family transcriptional regulator [Legionella pneumophila]
MKLVEINMSAKKNSSIHDRLLTEVELELMNIIWSLNKVTIKEVVAHLPKERPLAYTTVATVIKVLEQKGFLECQKNSFAHVFTPMVTKSEYESTCIDHMVANVFDGEPRALIQRLLMARKLQHDDIQAIEEALKQLTDGEKQAEVL